MRIAIVNWSSRKAGGAESYLDHVIGGLRCAGHETALFCETDQPADRAPIALPREAPLWSVSKMGLEAAISALRTWRPDVIYAHGLTDPAIEVRTLQVAPAVFFAHNYYGTCISGLKTFKYPVVRPCTRRFGWECLAHFYPHRCGGLSPLTMWSSFRRESRRLNLMHSYRAIVTASNHMRNEYLKHGFPAEAVKFIPLPVTDPEGALASSNGHRQPDVISANPLLTHAAYRLLFVGRMELLKGGEVLLDALPSVLAAIDWPLQMTFVGDGRERPSWEKKAAIMDSRESRLKIQFTGWLEGAQLKGTYDACDLLVFPSLWPEPFGLVGPEAGLVSLPAAGFAVGGVPEWLIDGVNGYLASGDPPSAAGLAEVIVKCLRDPIRHAQLRRGASEVAGRFSMANHMKVLIKLLASVAGIASNRSGTAISSGVSG